MYNFCWNNKKDQIIKIVLQTAFFFSGNLVIFSTLFFLQRNGLYYLLCTVFVRFDMYQYIVFFKQFGVNRGISWNTV